MKVCFNGQIIKEADALISPFLSGVQFGVGVFETFRVINQKPVFFQDHLNRLERSRVQLNFSWPSNCDLRTVETAVLNYLDLGSFKDGEWRARITLTPDFWSCKLVPLQPLAAEDYRMGVEVDCALENRIFAEAKVLSPLYPYYQNNEFFETLFFDSHNLLKEGNLTNVFIVTRQNVVVTPEKGVLHGIMRQKVIEYLLKNNHRVERRNIDKLELLDSRSIFVTNTIKGIVPVSRLENWIGDDFVLAHELQSKIFNNLS